MISAHATTKNIQKNIVKIPLKELKGYDGGGWGAFDAKEHSKGKIKQENKSKWQTGCITSILNKQSNKRQCQTVTNQNQ